MKNAVYVFGDAIIDRDTYVTPNGSVSSEDKTALHLLRTNEVHSLGGAGRVATLLAKASHSVKFFTLFGGDYESLFQQTAWAADVYLPLFQQPGQEVSIKQRFWGGQPQRMLFRVDHDGRSRWDDVASQRLQEHEPAAVLLVVDHNKGLCTPELKQALVRYSRQEASGQVLLVDPGNDNDARDYCGPYTVFKLNAKQAQRLAATVQPTKKIFDWDERQPEEVYYELLDRVLTALAGRWAGVWLTLGPGGMLYRSAVNGHTTIRRKCNDGLTIVDTCGAGDTAMATFASRITVPMLNEPNALYHLLVEVNEASYRACTVPRMERK